MQSDTTSNKDANSGMETTSTMESVLSLDDGSWTRPPQQPRVHFDSSDFFSENIIRQPSPPPVLARVQPQQTPISPTRVADPRPGPAKSFQDNTPSANGYQHLHIVSSFYFKLILFSILESNVLVDFCVAFENDARFSQTGSGKY